MPDQSPRARRHSVLQAERLHPSRQIRHVFKTVHRKEGSYPIAAGTGSADHQEPTIARQVVDAVGNVVHAYLQGAREGAQLPLVWLPDVEKRPLPGLDPALPVLRRHLFDRRHVPAHSTNHGPGSAIGESLYDLATTRKQGIIDIAVLVSGSGSNLQALIDSRDLGSRIGVVISDRPGIIALERARGAGLDTLVFPWDRFGSRSEFSAAVADAVEESGAKIMVLAGFMRILSAEAVARFPNRIVNIHPSLLPAFPGAHAVTQALAHGVKVTGVTVHLVDDQVDHGPIVAQRAVPILDDDDVESLHARIQAEEHDLYPKVVRALASGEIVVEGDRVIWR